MISLTCPHCAHPIEFASGDSLVVTPRTQDEDGQPFAMTVSTDREIGVIRLDLPRPCAYFELTREQAERLASVLLDKARRIPYETQEEISRAGTGSSDAASSG